WPPKPRPAMTWSCFVAGLGCTALTGKGSIMLHCDVERHLQNCINVSVCQLVVIEKSIGLSHRTAQIKAGSFGVEQHRRPLPRQMRLMAARIPAIPTVWELIDATFAYGRNACQGWEAHELVRRRLVERPEEDDMRIPNDDLLQVHRRVHTGEI